MRHIFALLVCLSFPTVYGYHYDLGPDGLRHWVWRQVTPADACEGWVADPVTGERVWWRWVGDPPRVVTWRTP